MNDIAAHFLQTYAAGGEPDEGWLFAKALQQAQLDYTPESLVRLDALLSQIRERAKPTRADLDGVKGRNFEALVAFYLAEIVRRATGSEILWMDRATAQAHSGAPLGVLPDVPGMRLIAYALDQGVLMHPIDWLESQLLPSGVNARSTAGSYIASAVERLRRDGPPEWSSAMFHAGRVASALMMGAANTIPVWPSMVVSSAPQTLRALAPELLTKALEEAEHRLNQNPDKEAWQVMGYAGYHEESGQRLDAIIVLAASYGEQGVRLRLAFPCRPANATRRFEILRPQLVEANLPVETLDKLSLALDRGIRAHHWSHPGSWNEYYVG